MCTGFEIAALAATGVGTALQMRAQQQAQDKQESILRRNAETNRQLEQKNAEALVDARDAYSRDAFDEALAQETLDLKQKYQDVQSTGQIPGEFGYGKRETPNIIMNREAQARGDAKAFSNDYAEKLAQMSGFSGAMFDRSIGNNRAAEKMDMNRSFMRGNNMVADQQIASVQANAGSPLGDLLAAGGQLGLSVGLRAPASAASNIKWAPKGMTVAQATAKGIPLVPDPVKIAGMPSFGGLY